jgi:P-type conjugative transfer protein TrbJ
MHVWNDVSNDIVQLKNIANIGSLLRGPSGGILGTLSKFDAAAYQAMSLGDMADKYETWARMAGENIVTMQQAMSIADKQIASDAVLARAIQQQSESAVGQVQVLQAANQMASLNFSATQQMHATLMSQAQAINAYNAGLASRQSLQDQATVNFLSSPPVAMTGGKRY